MSSTVIAVSPVGTKMASADILQDRRTEVNLCRHGNKTCRLFTIKRRVSLGRRRSRDLAQHPNDVRFDALDVGLYIFQRTGRGVSVEVPVEVDLVADNANLAVPGIALGSSIQASGTCGLTSRSKRRSRPQLEAPARCPAVQGLVRVCRPGSDRWPLSHHVQQER